MQKNSTLIALESLEILRNLTDRSWAAYPVSWLPYPKETTREAILEYVKNLPQHSIAQAEVLIYEYGLLAFFIDKEDAKLLNSMAIRNHADNLMQQVNQIERVELPEVLHGTPLLKKYLGLLVGITTENEHLRAELRSVLEALV
jgi:hypothetical protein